VKHASFQTGYDIRKVQLMSLKKVPITRKVSCHDTLSIWRHKAVIWFCLNHVRLASAIGLPFVTSVYRTGLYSLVN